MTDKEAIESNDPIAQIERMNSKYGFDKIPLTKEILNFKLSCCIEELSETMNAANVNHDADGIVDGLVDLSVFAIGILYNAGVDVRKAFREVMTANLQKERGTKPTRPNSGGVDLIKPEGWKAPSHKNNLGQFKDLYE
jgi:predicted HAD superfamily Cof-like phosphohydrolase